MGLIIKYVGPMRPGVETSEGVRFEYDQPVEVPDEQGDSLLAQGSFAPVTQAKAAAPSPTPVPAPAPELATTKGVTN